MDNRRKKESSIAVKNESDVESEPRDVVGGGSFVERHKDRILKYYLKKWPWMYHVCFDPFGYHKTARSTFAFMLGMFLGIFLYVLVIADLKLGKSRGLTCGTIITTVLAFGCASSLQFRCICLLTIPGLFGRAGRSVLKALVLGYVIGGPIFNLTLNSKEVMRSFACTGQLTYNLTKTKYDLMFRPFKQSMVNMKQNAAMMKNTVSLVKDLVEPIQQEIEGEDPPLALNDTSLELPSGNETTSSGSGDGEHFEGSGESIDANDAIETTSSESIQFTDGYETTNKSDEEDDDGEEELVAGNGTNTDEASSYANFASKIRDKREGDTEQIEDKAEYYEAKYRKKIKKRCQQQLEVGSSRCRDAFGHAYDGCAEAVTVALAWAVCWPMKLSFVCNLVQAVGGESACEPDGKIDVGIGHGYTSLKDTRDKLSESLGDAEIEFNMDTKPVVVGVSDAARAAQGVMRDFETRRRFLDAVVTLVKRCLSLVFLKIVYNASTYHHKYMSSIEHDNVYITTYFRKIDARRRARGSVTLLPLKKLERAKLVDPWELRRSRAESRHLLGQTAKLLLEIITASIFVLLDQLLIEVLDIVRRNARLEITQVGHHDMSVTVVGRGLLASLVRSLAHGLNTKRRISQLVTNEACLPRPNHLPSTILASIYGTYLLIWLMLLLDGYSQRMRRCCSAFFHRKREKRRVLYLYNETLRRRIGFLRFARARVASSTRARQLDKQASLFEVISSPEKKMPGWIVKRLSWFEFARRKCAVCDEVEPRKRKVGQEEFQVCPQCGLVYCPECWRDVGRECLVCSRGAGEKKDSGDAGDVEEEDDELSPGEATDRDYDEEDEDDDDD